MYATYGLMTQKAKRKPVLSQLIEVTVTPKYVAAVDETGEKDNHYLPVPQFLLLSSHCSI